MVFTSISFLYYFLPIVLITYFILPNKFKNFVLLVFSLIFYFCGEPKYILLMILESIIAYISAILIEKKNSKFLFFSTVLIHIFLLGIFKYSNFILSNINNLFNINIPYLNIILPIGISFYTFQIISYEADVYAKKVKAQKSFMKLATYIFLFPQLIAGPIVRYETIANELDNRKTSIEDFAFGANRFTIGLSKKVIIANSLGELCNILSSSTEKNILLYWIFAISYMLQIYFDFSGYSDIAIGLGRIFGFHFPENFNYPYTATSITDFWRKWHISLSSWFRDYVYIPLGGNRKGMKIQIRNILIVWTLTGIWHGASWNFVVWGLMFGIILIIEKFIIGKYLDKLPTIVKRLYTLFIVMISFVIFQSGNLTQAFSLIKGLLGLNEKIFANSFILYHLKGYIPILFLGILCTTPIFQKLILKLQNSKLNKILDFIQPFCMIILLLLVTTFLVDNSYNPFLYFRF